MGIDYERSFVYLSWLVCALNTCLPFGIGLLVVSVNAYACNLHFSGVELCVCGTYVPASVSDLCPKRKMKGSLSP